MSSWSTKTEKMPSNFFGLGDSAAHDIQTVVNER